MTSTTLTLLVLPALYKWFAMRVVRERQTASSTTIPSPQQTGA